MIKAIEQCAGVSYGNIRTSLNHLSALSLHGPGRPPGMRVEQAIVSFPRSLSFVPHWRQFAMETIDVQLA